MSAVLMTTQPPDIANHSDRAIGPGTMGGVSPVFFTGIVSELRYGRHPNSRCQVVRFAVIF